MQFESSPSSSAQPLFAALLQKFEQAGTIPGEPPTLVAPPAGALPAAPVVPPAGALPATPVAPPPGVDGAPAPGFGIELAPPLAEPDEPLAPPLPAFGTELPSEGSYSSSVSVVRAPHAASATNEAKPAHRTTRLIIWGAIYPAPSRRARSPRAERCGAQTPPCR